MATCRTNRKTNRTKRATLQHWTKHAEQKHPFCALHGSEQNHARHKMDAENKLENEWDKAPYLELGALKLYVTHQPIKFY